MIPSPEPACLLWSEASWTLDSLCWTLGCDWTMRILYMCIDGLIGYQGSGLIIKVSHSWSTDFVLLSDVICHMWVQQAAREKPPPC